MEERIKEKAKEIAKIVSDKSNEMLCSQLKVIAEQKGVSVEDLCLCYEIRIIQQKMDGGYYRFWLEVK